MAETTEGEREREESGASQGSEEDRGPVSSAGGEPRRSQTIFEPASEEAYNFRFAAGKAFREKFERFAEVIGIEYPHKHIERVLDEALEIALEKKDPKRKHERRLKREGRRPPAPRPGEVTEKRDAPGGEERGSRATSRYIPSEVRERVLERAGYRCEYCAPDGTRCTSRAALEIEHKRPFAIFQSHEERHLQVFCRRHNRLSAERVYGAEFIREKIERKREKVPRVRKAARIPSSPVGVSGWS